MFLFPGNLPPLARLKPGMRCVGCVPEGQLCELPSFHPFPELWCEADTKKAEAGGSQVQPVPPSWELLIPASRLDTTVMGILSAHREVIALLQLSSHLLRRQSAPKMREQPQALHFCASASLLIIPAHTEHPQASPALTLAALQSKAFQKIRVQFPASLETPISAFLSPGSGIPSVPAGQVSALPEAEGGTENVPEQGGKCWSSLLGLIPHGKKNVAMQQPAPAAGKLSHTAAGTAGGLSPARITQIKPFFLDDNNVPSP